MFQSKGCSTNDQVLPWKSLRPSEEIVVFTQLGPVWPVSVIKTKMVSSTPCVVGYVEPPPQSPLQELQKPEICEPMVGAEATEGCAADILGTWGKTNRAEVAAGDGAPWG